jgi:hypothetical protein
MKCEEARAAMLSGSDIEAVHQHLATCRPCRTEKQMWSKLRAMLSSHSLWEEPPPGLADRIMEAVGSHDEGDWEARTIPERRPFGHMAWVAAALVVVLAGTFLATRESAADWEMTLAATEEAPEGSAVVRGWSTSRGTRLVLDVSGIEDARGGTYYEIWLTAPDGRHVSAGTFNGSGRVTAFAGVRRADYPRIWITLESANQDLGPSRETYFDTT